MRFVTHCDQLISDREPWKLAKQGEAAQVNDLLYHLVESLRHIAVMLWPILPDTAENILRQLGLEVAKEFAKPLAELHQWVELTVGNKIEKAPYIKNTTMAGSARRWRETVGDLDFLCTSDQPEKAIAHFLSLPDKMKVLAEGDTKASLVLKNGMQCDFRVVPKESFGAALLYFTGSKEHNVRLRELAQAKGLTLNEYGLYKVSDKEKKKPVASKTEDDIYHALGLPFIPPELREDRGEIEAGLKKKLPTLVSEEDVRGDFHNHTNETDGAHTLEQMVEAARSRGWAWFFSADHSPSLTITNGLNVPRLRKKIERIRALNSRSKDIKIYSGSEVDILADGKMDYTDDVLEELDCVVASVHSRFNQDEDVMTARIVKALENPHVDILGHWSGRLINRRKSYAMNHETILQKARETQTAIEINGQPDRQELSDVYVKRAVELGIPLAVTTDAHATKELDHMTLAVHIARRGWAEPKNIINTMSASDIKAWFNS
jgi:DNA polymerase (family 10)